VVLPPEAAKNGKTTPPTALGAELAGIVREYVRRRGLGQDDLLFQGLTDRTAEVLRHDLRLASIEPVDAQGRVIDLHSLRFIFNAFMEESGVNL